MLKAFIKDIERDLLKISGDVPDSSIRMGRYYSRYEFEMMDTLLSMRSWALNNLFHVHCSDEEVRRLTDVNKQLYDFCKYTKPFNFPHIFPTLIKANEF